MAAVGGSVVTLKLEYTDGEIRRVSFPMSAPAAGVPLPYESVYAQLLSHLQKKLGQHQAFSMGYFDADNDFVTISDANDLAEAIGQVRPSAALMSPAVALAGGDEGKRVHHHHNHGEGNVLKIKVLVHQYEILKIVEDGVAGGGIAAGAPPASAAGVVNGAVGAVAGGGGRLPLPPQTPPPRSPVLAAAGAPMPYAAMGAPSPQHHMLAAHDDELRWLRVRVADLTEQVNRLQTLVHSLLPTEGRPHTGIPVNNGGSPSSAAIGGPAGAPGGA